MDDISEAAVAEVSAESREILVFTSKESLDKRGLSGGIEQKREPLAVNYL